MLSLLSKNPALTQAMDHAKHLAETAIKNEQELIQVSAKLDAIMKHLMVQGAMIETILRDLKGARIINA